MERHMDRVIMGWNLGLESMLFLWALSGRRIVSGIEPRLLSSEHFPGYQLLTTLYLDSVWSESVVK
jgi:hypothetical protein